MQVMGDQCQRVQVRNRTNHRRHLQLDRTKTESSSSSSKKQKMVDDSSHDWIGIHVILYINVIQYY